MKLISSKWAQKKDFLGWTPKLIAVYYKRGLTFKMSSLNTKNPGLLQIDYVNNCKSISNLLQFFSISVKIKGLPVMSPFSRCYTYFKNHPPTPTHPPTHILCSPCLWVQCSKFLWEGLLPVRSVHRLYTWLVYVLGRGQYVSGEGRDHHTDQVDRRWRYTSRQLAWPKVCVIPWKCGLTVGTCATWPHKRTRHWLTSESSLRVTVVRKTWLREEVFVVYYEEIKWDLIKYVQRDPRFLDEGRFFFHKWTDPKSMFPISKSFPLFRISSITNSFKYQSRCFVLPLQ